MIIKIKGKLYNNPNWSVQGGIGVLKIKSEKTFAEIAEDFVLEAGDSILQYNDNEEQIGEWYVEGMASVQLPGENDSDVVTIKYHISQIGKEAQEALTEDLDDATMSVLELASLVTAAKKTITDTASRIEDSQKEQGIRLDTLSNTTNSLNERLSALEIAYNNLADRVARLENNQ